MRGHWYLLASATLTLAAPVARKNDPDQMKSYTQLFDTLDLMEPNVRVQHNPDSNHPGEIITDDHRDHFGMVTWTATESPAEGLSNGVSAKQPQERSEEGEQNKEASSAMERDNDIIPYAHDRSRHDKSDEEPRDVEDQQIGGDVKDHDTHTHHHPPLHTHDSQYAETHPRRQTMYDFLPLPPNDDCNARGIGAKCIFINMPGTCMQVQAFKRCMPNMPSK